MSIGFIVAGIIGVLIGIFGKEFSIGDPDAISSFDRKSSRRSGRVVFVLTGVLLIAFGFKSLLVGR
jgi:hypothetical protein